MITQEQIDHWFMYPTDGQPAKYEELRAHAKTLAEAIVRLTPPSADQTAALRKLREAVHDGQRIDRLRR